MADDSISFLIVRLMGVGFSQPRKIIALLFCLGKLESGQSSVKKNECENGPHIFNFQSKAFMVPSSSLDTLTRLQKVFLYNLSKSYFLLSFSWSPHISTIFLIFLCGVFYLPFFFLWFKSKPGQPWHLCLRAPFQINDKFFLNGFYFIVSKYFPF